MSLSSVRLHGSRWLHHRHMLQGGPDDSDLRLTASSVAVMSRRPSKLRKPKLTSNPDSKSSSDSPRIGKATTPSVTQRDALWTTCAATRLHAVIAMRTLVTRRPRPSHTAHALVPPSLHHEDGAAHPQRNHEPNLACCPVPSRPPKLRFLLPWATFLAIPCQAPTPPPPPPPLPHRATGPHYQGAPGREEEEETRMELDPRLEGKAQLRAKPRLLWSVPWML